MLIPTLLPYPTIKPLSERPGLIGKSAYLIEPYQPGRSLLIQRHQNDILIRTGNWNGQTDANPALLGETCAKLNEIMRTIKLHQAQYYFAADGKLIDVQLHLDKFISPGMLRDLYGSLLPTQNTGTPTIINQETAATIAQYKGYIVKPTKFQWDDGPLYAIID